MDLNKLPDELLASIFGFLPIRTVLNVRQVSKRFQSISDIDSLWKFLCFRDYNITEEQLWDGWLYREFYRTVLYKYHFLVGWWKRNTRYFGGLLNICIERDGINCYECLPPLDDCFMKSSVIRKCLEGNDQKHSLQLAPNSDYSLQSRHKLRFWKLFSIMAVGKRLRVGCFQNDLGVVDGMYHRTCLKCTQSNHECEMSCDDVDFVSKTADGFSFICQNSVAHKRVDLGYFLEMEHGIRCNSVESSQFVAHSLDKLEEDMYLPCRITKFKFLHQDGYKFVTQPLPNICSLPSTVTIAGQSLPTDSVFVKLGLYSGTYSVHGWEILNFNFIDNMVTATKVTGDPNVPAEQISVKIYLDRPIFVREEDMTEWTSIERIIKEAAEYNFEIANISQFKCQKFVVPFDSYIRIAEPLPKYCKSRFFAEGQVASHGFHGPEFIPCIASVIDENCISVLWLKLHTVSFYYRATQQPS